MRDKEKEEVDLFERLESERVARVKSLANAKEKRKAEAVKRSFERQQKGAEEEKIDESNQVNMKMEFKVNES